MAVNNDIPAARKTYSAFIDMVKWAAVAVALVAAFVIFLIS